MTNQIKEILVNRSFGETRIAVVKDRKLLFLLKESSSSEIHIGNIFTATVTSFEKSLNAYFVDYGGNRPGFLPSKNAVKQFKVGEKIMIQIERGERDAKGAAVTTDISIASCNLVIMPFNKKAGGISQKLDDSSRKKMRDNLDKLNSISEDIGIIIRTSGVEKNFNDLESDYHTLLSYWKIIKDTADKHPAPQLIYRDNEVLTRLIKDWLRQDIKKIIVDHEPTFNEIKQQIEQTKPLYADRLHLHTNKVPLFTHYQIENDIESIYNSQVTLASGASLVIQQTEAMTTIDVNSAKSTKGSDIDVTAYQTNLEAAPEIARQVMLRNIGGLIVVDFIDMANAEQKEEVETTIAKSFSGDKAKIQMLKISNFGLLEISRQRLYPSVNETELEPCSKCKGLGSSRSIASFANFVLVKIEENSIHQQAAYIQIQLPADVSTYILNEKRMSLIELEEKQNVTITVIPNNSYDIPQYSIKRIQHDLNSSSVTKSYDVEVDDKSNKKPYAPQISKEKKPLVDRSSLASKTPGTKKQVAKKPTKNIFTTLWNTIFGDSNKKKAQKRRTPQNRRRNNSKNTRPQGNRPQNSNSQQYRKPRANNNSQNRNSEDTGQNRDNGNIAQNRGSDNQSQARHNSNNSNYRSSHNTSGSRLHGTGQLRTNRRKVTNNQENTTE